MTLKKVFLFFTLVPISLILLSFIIANRETTPLHLNPFHINDPFLTYNAPLFLWLFLSLIFGILIGGLTVKLSDHKQKKALRAAQDEVQDLKKRLMAQSSIPPR